MIKVAFMFQVPSFWPSWECLYNALSSDNRFLTKMYWLNGASGDAAQMNNAKTFLNERNIDYIEYSHERVLKFMPDYMVYQTPYDNGHRDVNAWSIRYKLLGIKIVYIPYGIEISDTKESRYKHFSLATVLNADEICVLSEAIKKEYDKYCINHKSVKATGLTRFDGLQNEFPLNIEVEKRAQGRKIILWKVHFPKEFIEDGVKKQATPDLNEYLKFVEWIKLEQRLFFVFMPHPKFTDETLSTELRGLAIKLEDELKRLSNVYIDTADDYRNSLMNADAIIVDRSAIMIEAGFKGVPVLYMHNECYEEPMIEPCQDIIDSYYQGTNVEHMINFCRCFMNGDDPKHNERRKIYQQNIGQKSATKNIISELLLDVHKETDINEMKTEANIIIFGTGELGRKCLDTYNLYNRLNFKVIAFCDNNPNLKGKSINNIKVIIPDEIEKMKHDYIVIGSDKYYREIYLQLTNTLGISKEHIINYDQFIVQCTFGKE